MGSHSFLYAKWVLHEAHICKETLLSSLGLMISADHESFADFAADAGWSAG